MKNITQNRNFMFVLYGCGILSLRRGKNKEFGGGAENSTLRTTFGPKAEEVAVGLKKIHSEELHKL
jgi:hypothetical protein